MELDNKKLPRHVAIIMDGNRRWAREHGLPAAAGHKKVVSDVIEDLIETAGEVGIEYITFWAWSSENWKRPSKEVKAIMKLFRWALLNKAKKMISKGARLRVIGNWQEFEPDIRDGIAQMIEESKENTKINVTFALNYGGRDEILRAIVRFIESRDKSQETRVKISGEDFSQYLDTVGMPDPDLIIRPGGEQRLSGFMLWQAEYAELIFPEIMMPDFGKEEFFRSLQEYQKRKRRFGC